MKSDYENALAHKYRTEHDGEFVPGVTTAINILDKPGLKFAAAKLTAEWCLSRMGGEHGWWINAGTDEEIITEASRHFDRVWREKAARGTRVHEVAERWTRGETVDVSLADSGFVDACERFHEQFQPEWILSECVVLNPDLGYGGRLDFIAKLKGVGVVLGDWKTSASPRPLENALQAAAYAKGQLATYDENGALTGFKALPALDGARTIYLHEDGTFEMSDAFSIISQDQAWEGFQACLKLYKIHKEMSKLLKGAEHE